MMQDATIQPQKTAILAAGGTGGHMFPAQSLAEILQKRGWKIILTTDARGMRFVDGFSDEVARVVLPTGSFSQGSLFQRLLAPFRILRGSFQAWRLFRKEKPDAVIGFGGYPAFPSLLVARIKGVPYFIHEQNAVLGRVNRLFHKHARKVGCGLWPVTYAEKNAVFIGNPVRSNVLSLAASPLPKFDPISLVVFGGSQGASALSKIVPEAISLLPIDLRTRLKITQQARKGEIEAVLGAYMRANVDAEAAPFFADLPQRMANSHFVIARAGASTLAELQLIGRGSVLVPLPTAANDHQRLNAKALVAAGAAYEYDEERNTPNELARWLEEVLSDQRMIARMADAAYRLARPNAAEAMADLIEKEIQ